MNWMRCHVQIIIALTVKTYFNKRQTCSKLKQNKLHKRFMKLENNTSLLKQLYIDN
jgi:hypothetical protein